MTFLLVSSPIWITFLLTDMTKKKTILKLEYFLVSFHKSAHCVQPSRIATNAATIGVEDMMAVHETNE